MVKCPYLPQSKYYLKIIGLPYFAKNTNEPITSQVFEEKYSKNIISSKILNFPQSYKLSRPLPIPIQLLFGSISKILKWVQKQRTLSTNSLTLVILLPLSIVLRSVQMSLSVRTVRSKAIQPSGVNHI